MKRLIVVGWFLVLCFSILSCGGKRVMVPPRINLKDHEVIGIIEFKCTHEGKLGSLATSEFINEIRRDQDMVRIVDLGTEREVLKAAGAKKLDREGFQAIGDKLDVNTIFVGELKVSNVKPKIDIGLLFGALSFRAVVDASLNVRMIEVESGASVWSSSASASREIGGVSIFGGKNFAFNADDPNEAYGELVDFMVDRISGDFQVTWERR
jgi:hypothetical protein